MVEDTNTNLTEDETELYDRQIRLWGIESQQRLRNARVLVIGLDGLGAEIVKNLVLSGVKSVLMLDNKASTSEDSHSNFLIPVEKIGQNRAEASCQRAQNLNPLVSVQADSQLVSEKSDEFFYDFEVVVSCSQDLAQNIRIDNVCRSRSIPFIAAGDYGTFGFSFYDYCEHTYSVEYSSGKKGAEVKTKIETVSYPSMESVFNVNLKDPEVIKKFKRTPPGFFILKVLYKFREEFKRDPTSDEEDLQTLVKFRDALLDGVDYPIENIPDVTFRCVAVGMLSPCCAIIGAVVSQEVIKVVSKKDEPHKNFFFLNPFDLSGSIQSIVPS
ncbi:SUMO-activating enzyme subunit 1 [Halyomorpha halys]|uniref:SUMO-activating enzyme subunit 1 n=1 Tax=Halyomorpha halys TaxID=286706 RepID=UPI0006D4FBA9|nr:SUMO-activating enzyme subunit 1 [Halyomorpha halys]